MALAVNLLARDCWPSPSSSTPSSTPCAEAGDAAEHRHRGLAGALPPSGRLGRGQRATPLNAWLMVAIIFGGPAAFLGPLAHHPRTTTSAPGVPMMPVIKGEASTRLQILLYSLVLVPLALAPAFTGLGGWVLPRHRGAGRRGCLSCWRPALAAQAEGGRQAPVRLLDPLSLRAVRGPCW